MDAYNEQAEDQGQQAAWTRRIHGVNLPSMPQQHDLIFATLYNVIKHLTRPFYQFKRPWAGSSSRGPFPKSHGGSGIVHVVSPRSADDNTRRGCFVTGVV